MAHLSPGTGGDFIFIEKSILALPTMFLSQGNLLCNLGRGYYMKHLCEIILKGLEVQEMPFNFFFQF